MRNLKYEEALEEIINFCFVSNSGIAIAEINDIITCKEFLEDLEKQFTYKCYRLSDFCSYHLNNPQTFAISPKESVIVIDELLNENSNEIIINLNFNRDWLLSLNSKIIIIISSATVADLIAYSNNFWSCVTICKSFSSVLGCTIAPYLFDDGTNQYETEQENRNRHHIRKNVLNISYSVSEMVEKTLKTQVAFSKNFSLLDFLSKYYEDQKDQSSIVTVQKNLFLLGMSFYRIESFAKAQVCFTFLLDKFLYNLLDRQIIDIRYMLGNTLYRQKKYINAVQEYSKALEIAKCNEDFSLSEIPISYVAKVLNNCGVALYRSEISELYDTALTYLDHAATNFMNAQLDGGLIWVLYNLSLMSQKIDDSKNAVYYIKEAIDKIPDPQSRIGKIICARYSTLYAFYLSNNGCISQCKEMISSSLDLLRNELIDQHPYILDAHFVFAVIFLQANNLTQALHCAKKAEKISKDISADTMIKLKIWILLGEINFYLNNYFEAKKYLVLAVRRARNIMSSNDIIDWINRTIKCCNEHLIA